MKRMIVLMGVLMALPCWAQGVVVLERGEVISKQLWVGAFAEVIYQGEDGKPTTANGKVREVLPHALIIGKGLWKETIAFDRMDVIILGDNLERVERVKKLRDDPFQKRRISSNGSVILGQLFFGGGGGLVGGMVGAGAGALIRAGTSGDRGSDFFYVPPEVLIGTVAGMVLGSAMGVRLASSDKFENPVWGRALLGSLVGFGAGVGLTYLSETAWPMLFIAPPVMATSFCWIGNERSASYATLNMGLMQNGGQGISVMYHF
jgi:hypothetical protein